MSEFSEAIEQADVEEARRMATLLQAENSKLKQQGRRLTEQLDELERLIAAFSFVRPSDSLVVPDWLTPSKPKDGTNHAIPVLMLSDLHLDEVVNLAEMDGMNAYSRAIAEQRLERVVTSAVELLKHYTSGVIYDAFVAAILGDIITGVIHDELARTNEAPPTESIAHWVPLLCAALKFLADELDVPIYVPMVDGNHDRFYGKTPAKQRATSSLAWIIYNWMADHLRDDDRIKFAITSSNEQLFPVYDTKLLLSHGDSFRSAGGIGGLYPSMLKWLLRRHQLYTSTKSDFDYALIGHWHQPLWGQDFVVNGSLKGYDEYAKHGGFTFNRPSQQLFVVTPENGMSWRGEVFAD